MDRRDALLNELTPAQRLALAYAAPPCQSVAAALLVLDARLAASVRQAKEPMLAQIRLAWWRAQLSSTKALSDSREDCLRELGGWAGDAAAQLTELVDGWEALIGLAADAERAIERLAAARATALVAALAAGSSAQPAAQRWALWDIARLLGRSEIAVQAMALAGGQDWHTLRLPRTARPVAMLHALARNNVAAARQDRFDLRDGLAMVRIGLFGR